MPPRVFGAGPRQPEQATASTPNHRRTSAFYWAPAWPLGFATKKDAMYLEHCAISTQANILLEQAQCIYRSLTNCDRLWRKSNSPL